MIKRFFNKNFWDNETKDDFLQTLAIYSDDEKCQFIYDIIPKILKSDNNMNIISAENILVYATQHFFNNVSDTHYKALIYYRLGEVYFLYWEDYIRAYTAYKKYELNNTQFGGVHSVLLRALILRDNFTYSEELQKELELSYGELDLGLRKDRIYENIGSLIVAQKEGNEDLCEKLTKRIKAIVKADEWFFLDIIFRKDSIPDSLKAPQKLLDYVNSL